MYEGRFEQGNPYNSKGFLCTRIYLFRYCGMTKQDLILRNRKFVFAVLNIVRELPNDRVYDGLVRQLVRCSTSIGANYRAACKAKSEADFLNKLKITEEESDEANYFLDILTNIDNGRHRERLAQVLQESDQLASIYSASVVTMKSKIAARKTSQLQNRPSYIYNLFTDFLYLTSGFNNTWLCFISLFPSIKNKYFIAMRQISLVG